MSKSGEYLKGTKRLQIINKWLRGIEDPFYEVYPTRKDGKYILKKRKEPLEVSDDEDADNEDNIRRDSERDNTKRDAERETKRDDEEASSDDDDEQDTNNKEDDNTNNKDEEDEQPPLYSPKYSHHLNLDPIYISLQILQELQNINEYLKKERERKEHKKLTKEIINEVIKQNKEDDSSDDVDIVYYEPMPKIMRRNKVFADMINK
ncbi:hypothetical protein M9Y10_043159 [Tritrichomonas musculus]|uniref:Uncharacterized protein n=1 Tax=Tritrichomonas musculus TaxID=1915356 RepID=A0ABR2JZ93_9EUKA